MSGSRRADIVSWLIGVAAGVVVDLGHSFAWRAHFRHAYGDLAFTVVLTWLALTPVVVTFVAALRLFSRELTVRRAVVVLIVLALTHLLQGVILFDEMFPGMFPMVAIGGRAFGLMASPLALAAAIVIARRRHRATRATPTDPDPPTHPQVES